jgi:SOS-response transcriptional repressor LexA
MTPQQRAMLSVIAHELRTRQVAPTYSELQERLGLLSKASVARLVDALIERGYVTKLPNRARALGLTEKGAAEPPLIFATPLGWLRWVPPVGQQFTAPVGNRSRRRL